MKRLVVALAFLAPLIFLPACAPRDKFGDRLLGIDSASNGRSKVTNTAPAPP